MDKEFKNVSSTTTTKVISARIPMELYYKILKVAEENKMNINNYIIMKILSPNEQPKQIITVSEKWEFLKDLRKKISKIKPFF